MNFLRKENFSKFFKIIFILSFFLFTFANTINTAYSVPVKGSGGSQTEQATATTDAEKTKSEGVCESGWFGEGYIANFSACIADLMHTFVAWIFGYIAGGFRYVAAFTALIFNIVFYFTVIEMAKFANIGINGTLLGATTSDTLVYQLWSLVRDLLNVFVFFIMVFSAIGVIFKGIEPYKKKFFSLMVFAILVNFSLLFVKIMVDVSNIGLLSLYTTVARPVSFNSYTDFTTPLNLGDKPATLGDFVVGSVNPFQDLNSGDSKDKVEQQQKGTANSIMFQIFRIIMYITLAFFLIYLSAIFITRMAAVIFMMITSPIVFAEAFYGFDSEDYGKIKNKIKDEFLVSLVYPIAIVLLLIVSSTLIKSLLGNAEVVKNGMVGLIGKSGKDSGLLFQSMDMFLRFAIFIAFNMIGFHYIKNIVHKKNYSIASKLSGFALNAAFGGLGYAGRNVVGRGANALLNSRRVGGGLANMATSQNSFVRSLGLGGLRAGTALRNSSFDLRNTKSGTAGIGALGNQLGANLGVKKGDKDMARGFVQRQDDSVKKKSEAEIKKAESNAELIKKSGKTDVDSVTNEMVLAELKKNSELGDKMTVNLGEVDGKPLKVSIAELEDIKKTIEKDPTASEHKTKGGTVINLNTADDIGRKTRNLVEASTEKDLKKELDQADPDLIKKAKESVVKKLESERKKKSEEYEAARSKGKFQSLGYSVSNYIGSQLPGNKLGFGAVAKRTERAVQEKLTKKIDDRTKPGKNEIKDNRDLYNGHKELYEELTNDKNKKVLDELLKDSTTKELYEKVSKFVTDNESKKFFEGKEMKKLDDKAFGEILEDRNKLINKIIEAEQKANGKSLGEANKNWKDHKSKLDKTDEKYQKRVDSKKKEEDNKKKEEDKKKEEKKDDKKK